MDSFRERTEFSMDFTDLKKDKAEKEAKNAKFGNKLKNYAILLVFLFLVANSSLWSFRTNTIDNDTLHILCIGTVHESNDFKCPIEVIIKY